MKAFIDSTAGLLASIAALVAALAAIIAQFATLWRKSGTREPGTGDPGGGLTRVVRLKQVLRKMLNVVTALLVAVSLGVVIVLIARTPPQCRPTTLTITSPAAGAVVNVSQIVTGHVACLNSGQHAWLVLQPGGKGGGAYFPQDEVSAAGSTWSTTAYFGQQSSVDDHRPYTILAVIADDTADRRFRAWLAAGATGGYPGLPDLTGAAVMTQVKVTRGIYQGP